MMRIYLYIFILLSQSAYAWKSYKGVVSTKVGELDYEVHFKEEKQEFANIVVNVMQHSSAAVIEYFRYIPDNKIHFVIEAKSKSANGSATVFPTNTIILNDYPPSEKQFLSTSLHWREALIIHELTHILTIGQLKGVMKAFSYVFGSIINGLAGIVPSWYAEGIAVWAESHFLPHGRLKNEKMIAMASLKLKENDFCGTISCLDTPPGYPYGSYAYWVGAMFIDYIEKEKPGTIRCVLDQDADSFPFFLDNAFSSCLGVSASKKFLEFRNSLNSIEFNSSGKNIDWQKGVSIDSGKAFWIEAIKEGEYIKYLDFSLKTSKIIETNKRFDKFNSRIWDLDTNKIVGPVILSTFGGVQNIVSVDGLEELEEKSQYAFKLNKDQFLLGVYENGSWVFKLWNLGSEPVQVYKIENKDIYYPKLFRSKNGDVLSLLVRDISSRKRQLIHVNLKKRTKTVMAHIDQDIQYLDACVTNSKIQHWFAKKDYIVKLSSSENTLTRESVYKSKIKILDMYFSQNHTVLHYEKSKLKIAINGCVSLENDFVKQGKWVPLNGSLIGKTKATENKTVNQSSAKDEFFYPGFRHFRPYYWLFNYSSINDFDTYGATTTLGDPAGLHSFNLFANHYPDASKTAGGGSYSLNLRPFNAGLVYNKDYSRNSVSRQVQDSRFMQGSLGLGFDSPTGVSSTQLYFRNENTADFISSRELSRMGIWQLLKYQSVWSYSFFQNASLNIGVFYQDTKQREQFWGHESKFDMNLNIFKSLKLYLKGTYGKLTNDRLSSGSITGGGNNETLFGGTRLHDFYGLDFGDIFGREVWTTRGQLFFLVDEYFKGFDFTPWFTKRVYLTGGVDLAKSDFSFVGDQLLINNRLTSYFAGISLDAQAFYRVPLNISLVGANVHEGSVKNDVEMLLLIKSSLNFY